MINENVFSYKSKSATPPDGPEYAEVIPSDNKANVKISKFFHEPSYSTSSVFSTDGLPLFLRLQVTGSQLQQLQAIAGRIAYLKKLIRFSAIFPLFCRLRTLLWKSLTGRSRAIVVILFFLVQVTLVSMQISHHSFIKLF